MPIEVFVTINFHLHKWDGAAGELWAVVQPHVDEARLSEWICSSATSAGHTYTAATRQEESRMLVPVNFPDDADLKIALFDADGQYVAEGEGNNRRPFIFTNRRRDAINVTNPERFARANVENGEPVQPVPSGPFAPGYNQSLRNALKGVCTDGRPAAGAVTPARLRESLELAFWAGTRRAVPADAVTNIDPHWVSLMVLEDSPVLVTNLHGLNGLTFRLGAKSQIPALRQTKMVRLVLNTPGSPAINVRYPSEADARTSFSAYFENLSAANLHPLTPPVSRIQPEWDARVSDRVYVRENFATFARQQSKVRGRDYFRRRSEGDAGGTHLSLLELRRFAVRLRDKFPEDMSGLPASINWTLWDSFEARLVPYRKFPAARGADGSSDTAPLHLIPREADRKRFYAEVSGGPDSETWREQFFANAILLAADGTALDRPPDSPLIPLGRFKFPWDLERPTDVAENSETWTVLYHGRVPDNPEVTVLLPRLHPPLVTRLKNDLWGKRWEFEPSADSEWAKPEVREAIARAGAGFDFISPQLPPEPPPAAGQTEEERKKAEERRKADEQKFLELAPQLVPSLSFRSDVSYDFAQSVSNLEGLLAVSYPLPAHPHPQPEQTGGAAPAPPPKIDAAAAAQTPEQGYVEDLINRNALKAHFRVDGSQPVDVNPWGQILPAAATTSTRRRTHHFQFRHRTPASPARTRTELPPPTQVGASGVREFFNNLYAGLIKKKQLTLALEHTYGERVEILKNLLHNQADFRPVLPTEVRRIPDALKTLRVTAATRFFNDVVPDGPMNAQIKVGAFLEVTDYADLGGGVLEAKTVHLKSFLGGDGCDTRSLRGTVSALPSDRDFVGDWAVNEYAPPFLSIEYFAPDASHQNERVQLRFEKCFLDPAPAELSKDKVFALYVRAWQAVAEVAHAKEVSLRGSFLRFNFRHALLAGNRATLADGLEPVEGSAAWATPADRLREKCLRWMAGEAITDPTVTLELAPLNGKTLFSQCTAFEFHLELTRPAEAAPEKSDRWELVTPLPELDRQNFIQKVSEVGANDPARVNFAVWVDGLRSRRDPVELTHERRVKSDKILKVFGNAGGGRPVATGAGLEGRAWIFQQEEMPTEGGAVVPSVCPLSFRPLHRNAHLQDFTHKGLRRYFELLQLVLDCNVPAWAAERRDWKSHFNNLHAAVPDLRTLLTKIPDELLFPLPNPARMTEPKPDGPGPAASAPPVAETEVTFSVKELRTQGSPVATAFRSWVLDRLWLEPKTFGDTKAFLYTRLKPAEGALTRDLFQILSYKLIRDNAKPAAGAAAPAAEVEGFDRDRFTFRDGLDVALLGDKHADWFGLAEILDDLRYDNQFTFSRFELNSLEGIIAQMLEPVPETPTHAPTPGPAPRPSPASRPASKARPKPIEILGRKLHLPEGVQVLPEAAGDAGAPEAAPDKAPLVRLASREPLQPPHHVFTGYITQAQSEEQMRKYDLGAKVSLKKFLAGQLATADDSGTPPAEDVTLEVRGLTTNFPFTRAECTSDKVVISAIFRVRGDEEAGTTAADALSNDTFEIDIEQTVNEQERTDPCAGDGPTPAIPERFRNLFNELITNVNPAAVAAPETVFDRELLEHLAGVVKPVSCRLPPPEPRPKITIRERADGRFVLELDSPQASMEAVLLQAVPNSTADGTVKAADGTKKNEDGPGTYLLLINVELPVWHEVSVGLIQARNQHFAPEFAQASGRVSADLPFRAVAQKDCTNDREFGVERRPYSAAELAGRLFGPGGVVQLSDQSGAVWRRHDLSITVFHHQLTHLEGLYLDAEGNATALEYLASRSEFPLRNRFYRGEGLPAVAGAIKWDDGVEWFPKEHKEFTLSFQWSSANNLQFFRIDGVRFKIKD